MASKTDSRDTTTTFGAYDALNRATTKTYSDGTPTVRYCYDGNIYNQGGQNCANGGVALSVGRLTGVGSYQGGTNISATNITEYDRRGRVKASSQLTPPAAPYPFSYSYYLDGTLAKEIYPSLREVSTCYDKAGPVGELAVHLGSVQAVAGADAAFAGLCAVDRLHAARGGAGFMAGQRAVGI